MSHLPGQPREIEYREVQHDFDGDELTGLDYVGHVGEAKHTRDWMSEEAIVEWEADVDRREAARARLGGFGFRGVT